MLYRNPVVCVASHTAAALDGPPHLQGFLMLHALLSRNFAAASLRTVAVRTFTLALACVSVGASLGASLGCKPALLPGTAIEDSEENRKVLLFLTRYQDAMQSRSLDKVIALCAADYYEDNGNENPRDDYNLDGLKKKLEEHFARTKELVLEAHVQKVTPTRDGPIEVVFRYNTRALVGFPSGDKWLTATEVNKIVLRVLPEDDVGFRIVSGL
jgi:hypothetical protein